MQQTTRQRAEGGATGEVLAMRLLAQGVPLSLLMDLACPQGPDSCRILASEGGTGETWWRLSEGTGRTDG